MKVLVIGAGGLGTNMVSKLLTTELGVDNVDFLCIDGSDANQGVLANALISTDQTTLNSNKTIDELLWLVANTNGAGKRRAMNVQVYLDYLANNYQRIPPADLYIVVNSTGGGSGSTLGPELCRLLTQGNNNVINVNLLGSEDEAEVRNTNNVLNGLAAIARSTKRNVNVVVHRIDGRLSSETDDIICSDIAAFAAIVGNKHLHLDKSDIQSFLQPTTSGLNATLNMLVRTYDEVLPESFQGIITALSIVSDLDNPVPESNALFLTKGVSNVRKDIHFFSSNKMLAEIRRSIKVEADEWELRREELLKDSFEDVEDEMQY